MSVRPIQPHLHRRDFLGVATGLIALPTLAAAAGPPAHQHGLNGSTLPPDKPIAMRIRVLDGPDFSLESQRGQVVVMNFFATWCPACRDEAAAIEAFAQTHASDTCVLSVDYREADDSVRAWRKKYAVSYPLAMDEHGIYFHNIGLHAFPSTLFFRPDGTVSCVYVGSLTNDALEAERLLALGVSDRPTPAPT